MQSINLLNKLRSIPITDSDRRGYKKILEKLVENDTSDCFIEVGFAFEEGLMALFENRNIPDALKVAYKDSFRNSDKTLYEHYLDMIEKGEGSVQGFISNLKGKFFEYELPEQLQEIYPGYEFNIAENVTQPIWDIEAISPEGLEGFYIQAKMWAESGTDRLIDIMEGNPDILYATSSEIRDEILRKAPELADQLVPNIDISNYEFTEEIKENLEVLVGNLGIDVPDKIGDILPYVSEIILGIKLIMDVIKVHKDFKSLDAKNKAKLSAVKAIVLFSRFGVSSVCVSIGGSAGAGIGNVMGGLFGGIGGAVVAGMINKEIKPYMLSIALALVGLEDEDMFYFNNKDRIDNLAVSYINIKDNFK